ncbi:pyridoxal-dependent decarboxylase [Streptomyces alanosinicus]|uniref:Histidine decarboxylase n=1 Tax=Streptomyces alanosinicus TaxID=68171 RepID=A0A919D818_9ACTN|nr:pyridoxal-dependent decarboxylase [Streptomyces alanosinicus]GHE15591.1 histidine decarboxylase [Streptomyces alanosinicus]
MAHEAEAPSDIPFGPEDAPWQKSFSSLRLVRGMPRVSPPTTDPRTAYLSVPEVPFAKVQLPPSGLDPRQYAEAEALFRRHIDTQTRDFAGYQVTSDLNYRERLGHYLDRHLNNVGDPYQSSSYTLNSKVLERAVLDYFASLWNAKWPHDENDPESYWGYLLTMGSSEGNLYGLWNARDYLSGKRLRKHSTGTRALSYERPLRGEGQSPHAYEPVAFFSADTHYSLTKAVRALDIDTFHYVGTTRYPAENPLGPGTPWPTEVPSTEDGAIDVDKLAVLVRFFAAKGYPVLVSLNYGSTFKGAYDDVEAVARTVRGICAEYGLDRRPVYRHRGNDGGGDGDHDERSGYWLHIDGALGAGYTPYLEMARDAGLVKEAPPVFDFRLEDVHSLTMSGHKWFGTPWACGVFMTRTGLQMTPPKSAEYIGAADTTFAGSRNGFSALLMWDHLARHSYDDQARLAVECHELAGYVHERLLDLQDELGRDLWVARSPLSLAVRFRRPHPDIVRRYSLACETARVDGTSRPYVHLYAMRHLTRQRVDDLLRDLRGPDAFAR